MADKVGIFAFSPDSKYIAFGDYDGPMFVYDIDNNDYLSLDAARGNQFTDLEWYKDDAHLFSLRNGNLDFIESATGTPVNSDLISNGVTQFSYNKNLGVVYYVTAKGLFSFTITP